MPSVFWLDVIKLVDTQYNRRLYCQIASCLCNGQVSAEGRHLLDHSDEAGSKYHTYYHTLYVIHHLFFFVIEGWRAMIIFI